LLARKPNVIRSFPEHFAGTTDPNWPMEQQSLEVQALLDAAVDAVIIINHRGIMEEFNRSAERLFGYAAREVIGRNVNILMTDRDRELHDAYLERYIRTGVAHIIGIGRDVTGKCKDRRVFPAFLSVGRISGSDPPRFVGFIQDLTLRAQALAAAQRERDLANSYLEAALTILVALDGSHRVSLINRAGCELLNDEEAALVGVDWVEVVVAAAHRAQVARDLDALLRDNTGRPLHREYPITCRDGSQRLVAWRCVVLRDSDGGATGILCSGDDITDSRRAELEARESRERLTHVSRLATMGEMASGISHELNQPLAAIANYASAATRLLAGAKPDLEDTLEALHQISSQALRAGEIIRRLRSLVRDSVTERELLSVNDVIEELKGLSRADARAHDVPVQFELAPDLPLVSIDRIQIQQVLLNLLRNSIDAMEEIPAGLRDVVIRTGSDAAGDVTVTVTDTGPGVPAGIRDRLFMPFVTSKASGTGLGLAISRTIAEAHAGRLEYRPGDRRGATFVLTLRANPG
jgi:two-component system, LuxR family, sensor kinase FixL